MIDPKVYDAKYGPSTGRPNLPTYAEQARIAEIADTAQLPEANDEDVDRPISPDCDDPVGPLNPLPEQDLTDGDRKELGSEPTAPAKGRDSHRDKGSQSVEMEVQSGGYRPR